jgi:hypothetical protein
MLRGIHVDEALGILLIRACEQQLDLSDLENTIHKPLCI